MEDNVFPENISLPPFDCNDWITNLIDVRKFAETNKRWPSVISKDPIEKRLGKWWSKAKHYANKKKIPSKIKPVPPQQAERVERLINDFPHLERDNQWDIKFRKIELRILSARTLWRERDASSEQMNLINWWHQQKTFVKKFRAGDTTVKMTEERAKKVEYVLQYARPTR